MNDFETLLTRCKNCTQCPLRANATQVVFGSGNPKADIFFIGEAPGAKEDILGVPFVGASGKFLNEMLESIELKRENVYIANIVKCRPPQNRDPKPNEIEACKPWIAEQIAILQPKVVVTLGRFAMHFFLPDAKISVVHGIPQRVRGLTILPLYHPAAALYNGKMREILRADFQNLLHISKSFKK